MAKIITINVQKGGVGKTTTVHELASNLTKLGKRVLAIDLDPQQNLSKFSGAPLTGYFTIYDVLKGTVDFWDAVHEKGEGSGENVHNYDIVTAHKKLTDAEKEFNDLPDVYKLTDTLNKLTESGKPFKDEYDYIVIDTPPSVGTLPNMALTAADYVVIPVEASAAGVQGMGQMFERIDIVTHAIRGTNKTLKVAGMLLTKYSDRTNLEKSIKQQLASLAERRGVKIFDTAIRESVRIKEAQAHKMSILDYEPTNTACIDYTNFTKELLKEIENNG